MYLIMIILLMFVFPVISILVEFFVLRNPAGTILLVGKWFVFWGVGVRLFLAGLRQSLTPSFTAEKIFGITDKKSLILVQELGFANLAIGILGICSLFSPSWLTPAAVCGALFYGLAGIRHITSKKNGLEQIAMISDLFLFVVLLVYVAAAIC